MIERFKTFNCKHQVLIVWCLRIIIGCTFIISGLSKMIDPWGFVYKIEQYLSVWGIILNRPLVVASSMSLSATEFVLGSMMLLGCYRRGSTWLLSMIMVVMLPLSLYIAISNPVSDCGCFGDFFVMSNLATLVKNIAISGFLVYLLWNNKKVEGFINVYTQWLSGLFCLIYIIYIGILGYNVQPIVDFRDYKVGTNLVEKINLAVEQDVDFEFIYEKDGVRKNFTSENLPDTTWTYIDRTLIDENTNASMIAIYDGDEDVTRDVLNDTGNEIILLIPEIDNADISHSYLINEMYDYIAITGGSMIGIVASGENNLEYWIDISMADYPLYSAEDTDIKELARGDISVIYLKDGIIKWKRVLNSIPSNYFSTSISAQMLEELSTPNGYDLIIYTLYLILSILALPLGEGLIILLKKKKCSENEKKDVTL